MVLLSSERCAYQFEMTFEQEKPIYQFIINMQCVPCPFLLDRYLSKEFYICAANSQLTCGCTKKQCKKDGVDTCQVPIGGYCMARKRTNGMIVTGCLHPQESKKIQRVCKDNVCCKDADKCNDKIAERLRSTAGKP